MDTNIAIFGKYSDSADKNNVLVRCEQASSGNWEFKPEETWITDHDPGFVNASQGDYRLRPEAEVFKRLPGFQPIPFDRIGVHQNPLRATWPTNQSAVPGSKTTTSGER